MKILHIVPTYYPARRYGGPIKSVHELNKWLVKCGVDVTVYTTNLDGNFVLDVPTGKEILIDGVKVYYFPITFRPWQYSNDLRLTLRDTLKDFDLVHITSIFLAASTLGAFYSKKYNKPYIISPRGSLMEEPLRHGGLKKKIYVNLIERKNLKDASAIHFTAEKEREEYESAGLPLNKALVIPNGIELANGKEQIANSKSKNQKAKKEFREKYGIPESNKIVLFLSRISWKKGLDTLIPAFAEMAKKEPDTTLVIAGGDDEGYLKNVRQQMANCRLQINKDVILTGMLSGENKSAAYLSADVFVLPSYSENFGMAVIEAMINGVPVVVTNSVGIAPAISKNNAGLVISKNAGELSEAILKILDNPKLAESLRDNAKTLVKNEFSVDKVAERWAKEYNNLYEAFSKRNNSHI